MSKSKALQLHHVSLKKSERKQLEKYLRKGKHSTRLITRARILLLCNEKLELDEIIEQSGSSKSTIYRICHKYKDEGLKNALEEKPRSGKPKTFSERTEANLTMLACSQAPEGRSRWTLSLLADKMVELKYEESISPKTVERMLKKTKSNRGEKNNGA